MINCSSLSRLPLGAFPRRLPQLLLMALFCLTLIPRTFGVEGFWVMAKDLQIKNTDWFYYEALDAPEGAYMGWLFSGKSETLGSIPLGRTLPPGSYRVFVKLIDYTDGKGKIDIAAGGGTGSVNTDNRDWNRYWTEPISIQTFSATSTLTIKLKKSLGLTETQKYLVRGLYITPSQYEDLAYYGEDRIVTYGGPKAAEIVVQQPANFLPNSSFELPLGQGWSFLAEGYERDFAIRDLRSPTAAFHGQHSLYFGNKGMLFSRVLRLQPGRTYTFSVWARQDRNSGMELKMVPIGQTPPAYTPAQTFSKVCSLTADWTRFSVSGVVSSGSEGYYHIQVSVWPGAYLDAVQVEEGPASTYKGASAVEMGASIGANGNLLSANAPLTGELMAYNGSPYQQSGSISYEIYDIWNKQVGSGTGDYSLAPNSRKSFNINLPSKTGIYRVLSWTPQSGNSLEETIFSIVPPALPGPARNALGISPNMVDYQLNTITNLGIFWARDMSPGGHFRWSYAELSPGVITWYDSQIQKSRSRGIQIKGTIGNGREWPAWADRNGLPDLDLLEDYVARLVTHYRGSVSYWEIWNEPIYTFTPQFYAQLLKRAAIAIRRNDPSAKIVAMGGTYSKDWILQVMNELGSSWKDSVDIISTHFYPAGPEPSGGETDTRAVAVKKELIDRYGVEVWNTEAGVWDEGFYKGANANYAPVGEAYWAHLDGERFHRANFYEPERLAENFLHCIGNGLTGYFYYDSRIYATPAYQKSHPTIMEFDDTVRSKGIAYSVLVNRFRNATGLGNKSKDPNMFNYVFSTPTGSSVALWAKTSGFWRFNIPSGWTAYDLMGNQMIPVNGQLTLTRTPIMFETSASPDATIAAAQALTFTSVQDAAAPNVSIDYFPIVSLSSENPEFRWIGIDDESVPSADDPNAVTYSYILEGSDVDWSPWTAKATAVYNPLPVGTYTFKVKAKDHAGNTSGISERTFKVVAAGNRPSAPTGLRIIQ